MRFDFNYISIEKLITENSPLLQATQKPAIKILKFSKASYDKPYRRKTNILFSSILKDSKE